MKYAAFIAVVAAVVSIPLAVGLAVVASPAADSLSMTPQDDGGRGMMHQNEYAYQHQGSPGDCPMSYDWEQYWNYSYNYSDCDCPCMN